jgi:hypothetical protein
MRACQFRAILSCMSHGGTDRRKSASINAALLLVAALIPLLVAAEPPRVDHTEVRPWGCQTCIIPADPAPADEGIDGTGASL